MAFHDATDETTYSVVVTNTGSIYIADEVVMAFIKPKPTTISSLSGTAVVIKQLIDFERVKVAPGSSVTVKFVVNATALALVDRCVACSCSCSCSFYFIGVGFILLHWATRRDGHTSLHPGKYDIVFSRGCVGCEELTAEIVLEVDRPIRLKTFRKWW
eukprot:SAG31_NODE_1170_length_9560_cov_3.537031_4_plen_158_part_00